MSSLQDIFDAANELAPEEWPAFLDKATANPALRHRALALLGSSRRAPEFLASPTLDSAGNAVPDPPSPRFIKGSRIGPYEILRRLGSGGSGIVFLALQHQPIQREVALKLLRTALEDEEPRWRFEVEKQAISRMDHPGIARVFDAGLTDGDRPWIAMEFVPGDPITRWCDHHALTLDERATLLASVCDAVHHAHQKGVIHRDLKPSNILVSSGSPGSPRTWVIDFGIARLADQTDTLRTRTGLLPGTPAYMSPEQLGVRPSPDARSDIYALGIILYELLTGHSPFVDLRGSPREVRPPTTLARITTKEEKEHLASLRSQNPKAWTLALRGDLAAIALKCLEADPGDRYASADAMASDLRAFVARRPVSARRPTAAYLALRFVSRHRLATVASAAFLVTLAAAGILIVRSERRAIRGMQEAEAERVRAENLFTGFSRLIHAGNPEIGKPGSYLLRDAVMDFSRDLPPELHRDPVTEARARHELGNTLNGMGEPTLAKAQFEKALDLLDAQPPAENILLRSELLLLLSIANRGMETAASRQFLLQADTLLKSVSERREARILRIRVLTRLAVHDADQGRYADGEKYARLAIVLAENREINDPELLSKSLWSLARIHHHSGRVEEARNIHTRRLALLGKSFGPGHPEIWNVTATLAHYDLSGPNRETALATLAGVAVKTERHFGPTHRHTFFSHIEYAHALTVVGQKTRALAIYRKVLAEAASHLATEPALLAEWQRELEQLEK